MKGKKASFWIIGIAVIICIIGCVFLLTGPKAEENVPNSEDIKTEEDVPNNEGTKTEAPAQIDEEKLESYVSDLILAHYKTEDTQNYFPCENHVVIDRQVTADKAVLYLMVLYQEYECVDGALSNVAGSHIPTVITLNIDAKGGFSLKEYWEPSDGASYMSDIESKFPEAIQDKADTQLYTDEQMHDCVRQAKEHFNLQ